MQHASAERLDKGFKLLRDTKLGSNMTAGTVDRDAFVKRCEETYLRYRETLEGQYPGKVVALYEDGVAAIAEDANGAYQEAVKNHRGRIFYFRRIGTPAASGFLL